MTAPKVWCVRHRDGWCATRGNYEPDEGVGSVPTVCGWFVNLPGGIDKRQPDCRDCLAALAKPANQHIDDRCMAMTGTAWTGPMYCGNPAKGEDVNGRPICGVHRRGNPHTEWYGDRRRYPEGTGGHWRFSKGDPR